MFASEIGGSSCPTPPELVRERNDDLGVGFVRAVRRTAGIGIAKAIGVKVEGCPAVAVVHGPWRTRRP